MKTRDLYLAAFAMSLGLTLRRGERPVPAGPVWFYFEGDEGIWRELEQAWLNDQFVSLRPSRFATHVRTLKSLVHVVG